MDSTFAISIRDLPAAKTATVFNVPAAIAPPTTIDDRDLTPRNESSILDGNDIDPNQQIKTDLKGIKIVLIGSNT